jgi:hypothetical protein
MGVTVTEVFRYPVKSCRGERLAEGIVEPWGLAGDRRWMVVGAGGVAMTARDHTPLILVTPSLEGDTAIRLTAPGMPTLTVPVPLAGDLAPVTVSRTDLKAMLAGPEAAAWFTEVTGEPARLVYLDDPTRRQINRDYSLPGETVSFADNLPLLVTSTESLAALNELIAAGPHAAEGPLPMTRFRPNVIVTGAPPWTEDGWRRLRIGTVPFRVARRCDRCVLTTVHPDTAVKGREPLWTLGRHRNWDGKVWFGVKLIPEAAGFGAAIHPGDPVAIVAA